MGARHTSQTLQKFIFFIILSISVANKRYNQQAIEEEVKKSLNLNIKNKCSWKFNDNADQNVFKSDNDDTFLVSLYPPSKQEIKLHRSIPVIQSKAYPTLAQRVVEEEMDKWAEETGLMWQLPDDHPAQNRARCLNITMKLSMGEVEALYEDERKLYRGFYLLYQRNAYIHPIGSVGLSCGIFQGVEGCESRYEHGQLWWNKCNRQIQASGLPWSTLWLDEASASSKQRGVIERCKVYHLSPRQEQRVFVIPALWDFNYHHFTVDSLARLVRHMDFLRANPDIKIHIRAFDLLDETRNRTAMFKAVAGTMRRSLFDLLQIPPERVIYGPTLAREVFIPRPMRCSYVMSNPLEIRLLGRVMTNAARKQLKVSKSTSAIESNTKKKNLVILQRYSMLQTWGWREWDNDTLAVVVRAFGERFPEHNIVALNSNAINTPDYCLSCEILAYSKADILVGVHGAGLTNMMYMPPGGLVVELATQYNPAVMPVCGYYGSMSAVCGHHHYLYAYNRKDSPPIDTPALAKAVADFYGHLHLSIIL